MLQDIYQVYAEALSLATGGKPAPRAIRANSGGDRVPPEARRPGGLLARATSLLRSLRRPRYPALVGCG